MWSTCNKTVCLILLVLLSCADLCRSVDETVNSEKPRQCYSCAGINCQRTTKSNVTVACMDLLDICVTIFDGATVIARGCYGDQPELHRHKCDARNNPECFKCFGQLCNKMGREDLKCIQCNSSDNSKCSADTTSMIPTQCVNPTAPNSYCYVRKTSKDVVSRGCLGHLHEQLDCMRSNTCSMCLPEGSVACNSYKLDATGSGSKASHGVLLTVGTATMLLLAYFLR